MKRHFVLLAALCGFFFLQVSPLRAEPMAAPLGPVSVSVPYTGVVIGAKGKAEVEVVLRNNTDTEKNLTLSVEGFKDDHGIEARLANDKWNGYGLSEVRLGVGKSFDEVKAVIVLTPAKEAKPALYEGALVVSVKDGEVVRIPLTAKYEAEEVLPVDKILETSCAYPVLENPAGSSFSYEVKVENKGKEAVVTDFALSLPSGWSGAVSPRYEAGKKIQSLRMDGSKTETLMVTVNPPSSVEKGEYPLSFVAKAGDEESSLALKSVVTGTYKLSVLPDTQRLNFETVAGVEKTVTLYVWNEGSAPVQRVKFFASKPDNWEVSFNPESLPVVDPLDKAGKPEQVKMTVKAPERTIPGDYQISLTASGDEANDKIVLRGTVNVSTAWGWAGISVIAAVLALLFGTFWKLKRR